MKLYRVFFAVLLVSVRVYGITIQKIVHHDHSDQQMIELCVLELYFSQPPCFNFIRSVIDNGKHMLILQCPDLDISTADKKKLDSIASDGYTVTASMQPNNGKITITYDADIVSVVCSPVVSISMQHGVVIRFFDQSLLKKLSDQSRPILSVACLG